ncbi:MAG: hypothetical protein AB7F72_05865 [Afipia sp.]
MTTRPLLIAVHGYGTYAISYRHMIELAKTEAPHIRWAMLLPTSHHLDVVSEVLEADSILCLENEQSRSSLSMPSKHEFANYSGNLFSDIEAEKKVFKHRPADEQLMIATQVYRIYKSYLLRLKPTHLLMAHIETFDGKVLASLAQELNIPVLIPTDLRHLGGIYFSRDVQERIPDHREVTPEGKEWAEKTIATFRSRPGPAFVPEMFSQPGESLLPIGQKSLPKRAWGLVARTWRNPRLFESELLMTSLKYTFPSAVVRFRSIRGFVNGRNYDSKDLADLPSKFIYYPLQVTPESSINTPAPYYVDQMRAIDAIRFAMPSDWTLVVKEHRASLGIRPMSFYRELRCRAGVHIAHATMSSIELIKKAQVTISVTGSATLEAFLLGRPAIVLGGCFVAEYLNGVSSIGDLPSRIKAAASVSPDDRHIISSLAEIYSVRYECVFRPADEPGHFGNRIENVRRMIGAILDHIGRLDAENAKVASAS